MTPASFLKAPLPTGAPPILRMTYADIKTVKTRLESNSMPIPVTGCLIWMGATDAYRYGAIRIRGKRVRTHRAAWEVDNGPIPDGMHVLHKCDVGFCINPDHLFLGTPLDNSLDKERKGRGNHATGARNGRSTMPERTARGERHFTHLHPEIVQGENNGRAKLTEELVREIRLSKVGCLRAARFYGVSSTTIKNIRNRKLWSHIV